MKITLVLAFLLLSLQALASKVEVEVNGMNCGMCIESITKELKTTDKIEHINVNIDDRRVSFNETKGKKISDGEIRSLIKKAGYEPAKIRRY